MTTPLPPQPFWTSKTFWVLALGLMFNLARWSGKLPTFIGTSEVSEIINTLVGILGIVFRWQSNQSLTVDPTAVSIPPSG